MLGVSYLIPIEPFVFIRYNIGMIKVLWPSRVATQANVWRVLDLSGITKSVRSSKRYVRGGCVYLNGTQVTLKDRVEIGSPFTLELRVPRGRTISKDITLIHTNYIHGTPRNNSQLEKFYK